MTKIYEYEFTSTNPAIRGSVHDDGPLGRRACFDGGAHGGHDLDASDPERVRAHWDGYCESNGCVGTLTYREVEEEVRPAAWGLVPPDPSSLHWGARAIYDRRGTVDVVWDRQDMGGRGSLVERKRLAHWVNDKALPWLRSHCEHGQDALSFDESRNVEVAGDGYRLRANPRESFGYLYIVAYADPTATDPTPKPITAADAKRREREMMRRTRERRLQAHKEVAR